MNPCLSNMLVPHGISVQDLVLMQNLTLDYEMGCYMHTLTKTSEVKDSCHHSQMENKK